MEQRGLYDKQNREEEKFYFVIALSRRSSKHEMTLDHNNSRSLC